MNDWDNLIASGDVYWEHKLMAALLREVNNPPVEWIIDANSLHWNVEPQSGAW